MNEYLLLFATSLIWGITNPILKRNSKLKDEKEGFKLFQIFSNLQFLIPQLVNLSGSVLFFLVLSKIGEFKIKFTIEIIIAVPVVNSLTFMVTEMTSIFILGEKREDPSSLELFRFNILRSLFRFIFGDCRCHHLFILILQL
jgi:hypothetical protein